MSSADGRESTDERLPLSGILVADFSRVLAGPLCTQMLGDYGARVIKVEDPRGGDETRRWGPPFVNGVSAYYLAINRHKESLSIDLRTRSDVVEKLVSAADVVVDNFLPAQRREFGLNRVRERNPRAIHCMISGFEPDSPEAALPGYDLLAQAGSGLMSITGTPGGPPAKAGVALSDVLTAHYAFGAITTALFAREKSGEGASVEVSLFGATTASLINVAQSALLTGKEALRYGNAHPSIVPYQVFEAADRAFAVGAGTDRHFRLLCDRVLELPDLATDPKFVTNADRVEHRAELIAILEAKFRTRDAADWVARCRDAGVPAELVKGVLEALESASMRAQITHPDVGTYEALRHPIRLNARRLPAGGSPPRLGEHTETILRELGLEN